MTARKQRIPVVIDTNVFVRNFKSRRKASPNRRVIRLWLLERKLQLVVSEPVLAEFLEIFDEILRFPRAVIEKWCARFRDGPGVTLVNLARRDMESRDPDDNTFLSTARAGKAKYLITNDQDLLDLTEAFIKTLPFSVTKPDEFLAAIGAEQ